MFVLKADNRQLTQNAKYSYLTTNNLSGIDSLVIINTEGFSENDYILIGEFGNETTEIAQINTMSTALNKINLKSNTSFAHSESTKITKLNYNQVRFYHTSTDTFSASSPLGTIDIQPDGISTQKEDTANSTGYGWFVFLNETTGVASRNSNSIPYAGFEENSVKKMVDRFFKQLNNRERKLITTEDAIDYLNDGYTKLRNHLNLVNTEYNVEEYYDLTTASGQAEYSKPTSASRILSIYDDSTGKNLDRISYEDVVKHNDSSSNTTKFFVRGGYIGFSPVPSGASTYQVTYQSKSTAFSSISDSIEVPNNDFYILLDYMLYRASPTLNRDGTKFLNVFNENINMMKVFSHNQDGSIDSWGIKSNANV